MDEKQILELVKEMTYKDAPEVSADNNGIEYVELTESLQDLLRAVYGCNKF